MSLPKTYIVIVTYNGMNWLPKTLASIGSEFFVILVDNGSTDNTLTFIKEKYPDVLILAQGKNLGFGKANNVGIKKAISLGAAYIFLLNQDAYIESSTLSLLIAESQKDSTYGIISPIHYNGDYTAIDKNFASYITYENPIFLKDALENSLNSIYEVAFVNAAGWLLPISTIQKVGLFDENFFMYGEDDNYIQRLKFHRLKLGIVPKAKMAHDRSQKSKKPNKLFSDAYFQKKKIDYLVTFANINDLNWEKKYNKELFILTKKAITSLLRFQWSTHINFLKQRKMLRSLYPKLIKSRQLHQESNTSIYEF